MSDMCDFQLGIAKKERDETRGIMDSGTLACRLWHVLDALIEAIEKKKEGRAG